MGKDKSRPWADRGLDYKERKRLYAEAHDGDPRFWLDPEDYRNKGPEDKQKYSSRMRAANEFEETLMVNGVTRYRFGQVVGVKGSTVKKYVESPELIRVEHIEKLADFLDVEPSAIFRVINEDYARVLKQRGEYERYWRGQGS